MKKIKIQTELDASFIARVVSAHNRLNSAIKFIKEHANACIMKGKYEKINEDVVIYDTTIRCKDINNFDYAKELLDDIMFALVENEEGTAPGEDNSTFKGSVFPKQK